MPLKSETTGQSSPERKREAAAVRKAKRSSSSSRECGREEEGAAAPTEEETQLERTALINSKKKKKESSGSSSSSSGREGEHEDAAAVAEGAGGADSSFRVNSEGRHSSRRNSRSSNNRRNGSRSRRRTRRRSRSGGSSSSGSSRSSSSNDKSSGSDSSSRRDSSSSSEEEGPSAQDAAAAEDIHEERSRKHRIVRRERAAAAAAERAEVAAAAIAVAHPARVKRETAEATPNSQTAASQSGRSKQSSSPDSGVGSSSQHVADSRSNSSSSGDSSGQQAGEEEEGASEGAAGGVTKEKEEEEERESSSSEDDAFGPLPARATKKKKLELQTQQQLTTSKKAAAAAHQQRLEELYLRNLPSSERYYKSFMHRDEISHVVVSPLRGFIITGSVDGHVKFWIRTAGDIEFVKHFRAHVGALHCLCVSASDGGSLVGSVGSDNTFRLFEVVSFDMLCLLKLSFSPACCEFVHPRDCPSPIVAISSMDAPDIYLFKPTLQTEPCQKYSLHLAAVHAMKYSDVLQACVSADAEGGLELWCTDTCRRLTRETNPRVRFSLKSETDFYELAKNKTHAISLAISPDGVLLAVLGDDAHIRLFRIATGKLAKVYLDTVEMHQTAQHDPRQAVLHAEALDFEFRVAAEKEMNKSRSKKWQTLCFDESSSFLIYPSLLGIKVVNVRTNKLCRIVGRPEHSLRFLAVALYQAHMQRSKPLFFGEAKSGGDNKDGRLDAVIVASAFKKNRVYFFTPEAPADAIVDVRDIFNEKPSKEEQEALAPAAAAASPLSPSSTRVGKTATIFTTAGDIFIRLFPQECPKTVENFCTHARNGYYDRCIFHRVIKGFMIQTGDPNGDGTGGESIWGGDFEDEFHRALKHDRPFTVSMANAGPNTNGSQFFITTVPCSWLDNKHTVFGRVVQGMDVVTKIECVPTNVEDKPKQDVKILTIKVTS